MIDQARKPLDYLKSFVRNSPWLAIALGLHVMVFAIMGIWYIQQDEAKKDTSDTKISVSGAKAIEQAPVIQPPEIIERKAVPKNDNSELVSYEEDIYMPQQAAPDPNEDLHLDRGDPTAIDNLPPGATGGTSIGVGTAGGHYGTGSPSAFAGRRVGRGGKGRAGGSTVGTEKSVLEGLRWLIRHQNEDGSWADDTLTTHCNPKTPCIAKDAKVKPFFNEGLTGLSLLCFLGQGITNESKQKIVDTAMGKQYQMGDVVKDGLKWLVERQKTHEDGRFSDLGFMYNEALSTMALAEVYGLTRNKYWKGPAQKGVDFLVAAQKQKPGGAGMWGWRYMSRAILDDQKAKGEIDETSHLKEIYDADISVTCWVVMALKSARMAGLEVPDAALDGALDYAKYTTGQDGLVGYQRADQAGSKIGGPGDEFNYHVGTMSALGMLVRTFVTHDVTDPFLELAAKQLVKDTPDVSKDLLSVDYYYWYYGTLALYQLDGPDSPRKSGKYWGPWNKAMIASLEELQNKSDEQDVCSRGGWLTPDRWSRDGHSIYSTAINTLTLEVYYRFENAFGVSLKDKKGGEAKADVEPGSEGK